MLKARAAGLLLMVLSAAACGSTRSNVSKDAPTGTPATSVSSTTSPGQPAIGSRRNALLIRTTNGENPEACKLPGAIVDPMSRYLGSSPQRLCFVWDETILTGDDVTAAVAQRDPGQSNGWCVAPTLTPAGAARLRAYMASHTQTFFLPEVSHGKVLTSIGMQPQYVRSGACWITSDGMTESAARALARELS